MQPAQQAYGISALPAQPHPDRRPGWADWNTKDYSGGGRSAKMAGLQQSSAWASPQGQQQQALTAEVLLLHQAGGTQGMLHSSTTFHGAQQQQQQQVWHARPGMLSADPSPWPGAAAVAVPVGSPRGQKQQRPASASRSKRPGWQDWNTKDYAASPTRSRPSSAGGAGRDGTLANGFEGSRARSPSPPSRWASASLASPRSKAGAGPAPAWPQGDSQQGQHGGGRSGSPQQSYSARPASAGATWPSQMQRPDTAATYATATTSIFSAAGFRAAGATWPAALRPLSPRAAAAAATTAGVGATAAGVTSLARPSSASMASIYLGDSIKRVSEANRWSAALGSSRRYQIALAQPGCSSATLAVEVFRLERCPEGAALGEPATAGGAAAVAGGGAVAGGAEPGVPAGGSGAGHGEVWALSAAPLQRMTLTEFIRLHSKLRAKAEQQRRV